MVVEGEKARQRTNAVLGGVWEKRSSGGEERVDLRLAGRGHGRTANIYRVATYIEPLYTEIRTLNLINDRVAAAPPARELDLAIGKTQNVTRTAVGRKLSSGGSGDDGREG